MLRHDSIDISEGIHIKKTNASKEWDICHYWYFLDKNVKYEPYLCSDCHDLMQKVMKFIDISNVSVKGSYFRIQFWYMSKNDAINIIKNSNLNKKMDHFSFIYKLSKKQMCCTKYSKTLL